jgi:hypothetical protein
MSFQAGWTAIKHATLGEGEEELLADVIASHVTIFSSFI